MIAKAPGTGGFILVILLFLLLLLAVTAMSMNFRSGMQASMAANRTADVQTYQGQLAVIEQSLWKLAADFGWRVPAGENYIYGGVTYNRKVFDPDTATYPALSAYADAVILSARAPDAARAVNSAFRYRIETPFLIRKPRQIEIDSAGNLFFADYDNHSVWRIDAVTGSITRVAGNGRSGSSGDGGAATSAQLNFPCGVCIDSVGNLYIADTDNHRIRKVTAGVITTVVNTSGSSGDSGDGGAATAARLNKPRGVRTDAAGNLYIADTDNHRIRKVTAATGIITIVAGTTSGLSGDNGPATSAQLNNPRALFVDAAGNVYIADTDNHRIRKVTAATGIITTVAGTDGGYSGDDGFATEAQLKKPRGVWMDGPGNLYIADTENHRVRWVRWSNQKIYTSTGIGTAGYSGDGGPATDAKIDWPTGVAVRSTGEIVIADTNNSCLRQVSLADTISTLPMTVGPGLNTPNGVAVFYDASQQKHFLYIADQGNHRVRRLDATTNAIVTVAGTGISGSSGDGGLATSASLDTPADVAVDTAGNLYIADTNNHKIRKVTAATGVITTVAGSGEAGSSGDGGWAVLAKIDRPEAVFVDAAGKLFIADTGSHRIRKVTAGIISRISGTSAGFAGDGGDAGAGVKFDRPRSVWVDGAGNILIADTNNNRIRKITAATNIINTVAGSGSGGYSGDGGAATAAQLRKPQEVFADGAGNLYIADTDNHVVRFVNSYDGKIRTLAGTATGGYNGDGLPAVQARLNGPRGVAHGGTRGGGRIYIGDTENNRIRRLSLAVEPRVYGP